MTGRRGHVPHDHVAVTLERVRLWTDRRDDHGPFDIIGDIHGCFDELIELLGKLGYLLARDERGSFVVSHPTGRRVVFLGDLVDRGPKIAEVLQLVRSNLELSLSRLLASQTAP